MLAKTKNMITNMFKELNENTVIMNNKAGKLNRKVEAIKIVILILKIIITNKIFTR